jgi:hypothetical protein
VSVRLEDDREVEYDFGKLDELTLAYAISIHKSQGSEYPRLCYSDRNGLLHAVGQEAYLHRYHQS